MAVVSAGTVAVPRGLVLKMSAELKPPVSEQLPLGDAVGQVS